MTDRPDAGESESPDADREPLADLPLRSEAEVAGPAEERTDAPDDSGAAALGPRVLAFAGDAATTVLAVSAAVLAGSATSGRSPRAAGLLWAGAFALLFSFFLVVVSLCLFGRTVGMALAGLEAERGQVGRRLLPAEAVRRWLGTLAAAVTLGAPLVATARDRSAPTPADRFSGRRLVREDAGVEA